MSEPKTLREAVERLRDRLQAHDEWAYYVWVANALDAILAAHPDAPPAPKCDGNHGGPRCSDPECWNDEPDAPEPGTPLRSRCGVRHPVRPFASCGRWKGHGGEHREMGESVGWIGESMGLSEAIIVPPPASRRDETPKTCATCRWWSEEQWSGELAGEHTCLHRDRPVPAMVTPSTFGCNQWADLQEPR